VTFYENVEVGPPTKSNRGAHNETVTPLRLGPATPVISVDKAYENWLPWQRPLSDKTNARLIIGIYSSTKPGNSAKIGPVDFKITGLAGIVKNK